MEAGPEPVNLRETVSTSVRRCLSVSRHRRTFLGTSIAINRRMVLSCRHVIEAKGKCERLVLDGGNSGDIGQIDWSLCDDPYIDAALGILQDGIPDFSTFLNPSPRDPKDWGNPVHCFGFSQEGQPLQEWSDNIAAQDNAHGLVYLQNSINKGCSGGPVIDNGMSLVALVVSRGAQGADKHVLPIQRLFGWMQKVGFVAEYKGSAPSETDILEVPIGPQVLLSDIPLEIIEVFSEILSDEMPARALIATTNQLIMAKNPENMLESQLTIPRSKQPAFDVPMNFWLRIFSSYGHKSRRSVAALLVAKGAPNHSLYNSEIIEKFWRYLFNARR